MEPRTYTWFTRFCWYLNVLKLSWLAAGLRWLILKAAGRRFYCGLYKDGVYKGWIAWGTFGVLAFIRDDWSYQFRW